MVEKSSEKRSKNIVYLELAVIDIDGTDRPVTLDGRQIAGLPDKELFDLRKTMDKLVENNKGDSTFDEIAEIEKALKAPQLERDKDGKPEMFQQMGGASTPKQRGFNLDEQRVFNRIINYIESLKNKNDKNIVLEFHKNAELIQPKWEDMVELFTIMDRHLNENIHELGTWFIDLYDKLLDAKHEAEKLIEKKS